MNIETGSNSGPKSIKEFYLSYKGNRISNKNSAIDTDFPNNSKTHVECNFSLTNDKIDNLCINVENNDIFIKKIEVFYEISKQQYLIGNLNYNNKVSNSILCLPFQNVIDLNNINVSEDLNLSFNSDDGKTKKFSPDQTGKLDNLLKSNYFCINFTFKITKNSYKNNKAENCLFTYGHEESRGIFNLKCRLGTQRDFPSPIFIYFMTNRDSDRRHAITIPEQFRKFNENINVCIEHFKLDNLNGSTGYYLSYSVNGVRGIVIFDRVVHFRFKPNKTLFIKNPNFNSDDILVYNVSFTSRTLKLISSDMKTRKIDNDMKNNFNQLLNKLPTPYYLLRTGFNFWKTACIVYKRRTSSEGVDMFDLFHNNWFNEENNVKNKFHEDFDLYQSLEDAINDRGEWKFCNFNVPGVGFPRDCFTPLHI